MDDMTKDGFWCEFGCEVRIYYDRIEFSDGKKLLIPRNVKTDKIHNCPNLDPSDPDVNLMPEDQAVYEQMTDEHGGHFWDNEELGERALAIHESLMDIDNLEFRWQRAAPKTAIIEFLNEVHDLFGEITISSGEGALPACLQNTSETIHYDNVGSFPPIALLGLFYEMDGSLEDAKKCFEIQTEVSFRSQKDYYQSRIEEINRQFTILKKIDVIKKQIAEQSKKPQTSQQQDQTSLQAIRTEAFNFELENLRTYAFSKITKPEMTKIIKTRIWHGHSTSFCEKCEQDVYRESWRKKYCERCDECKKHNKEQQSFVKERQCNECKKQTTYRKKTLFDKVKEMQAKEKNDTMLPLDPTYWDYLDLSDKIKILIPHINNNTTNYLQYIRRHRNLTEHPKHYKKDDLEQRNKMIMLYIQECKHFFEQSKFK